MEKNLTQPFVSPNEWFKLEYPRMWEMEVVDNIPAFFDPLFGKGALQVFSVKLGDLDKLTEEIAEFPFLLGETLPVKMKIFLEKQSIAFNDSDLKLFNRNNLQCVAHEYFVAERFYMACMMQKNNIFLLTLYNCIEAPSNEEALAIGEILKTVEILK